MSTKPDYKDFYPDQMTDLDKDNPFRLENEASYQRWRNHKLELAHNTAIEPIEITSPKAVKTSEYRALSTQVAALNMGIFRLSPKTIVNNETLKTLGSQLGLNRIDRNLCANESGISELRNLGKGRHSQYIPYTNRRLGWHTDGYYNHQSKTIRSFILYCVNSASQGGDNQLLDPELAYIYLRDQNSGLISALMRMEALSIPETTEQGKNIRPQQQNPVFQTDPGSGHLLMRYTQRKTHIKWHHNETTRQALSLLADLLASHSDHILNIRLNSGEGLVCNNVLHNRSAFIDNPKQPRIMLRARYYDRFRSYL